MSGKQLRDLRKLLGLSQTEFARLVGSDSANISAMELGKRGVPQSVLLKLHELGHALKEDA